MEHCCSRRWGWGLVGVDRMGRLLGVGSSREIGGGSGLGRGLVVEFCSGGGCTGMGFAEGWLGSRGSSWSGLEVWKGLGCGGTCQVGFVGGLISCGGGEGVDRWGCTMCRARCGSSLLMLK